MVHKGGRLLLILASPVVLGPKECVMIIPLIKLSENVIQNITSVCQIPEILTVVSTKSGGEFSVKIFNVGVKARTINQNWL